MRNALVVISSLLVASVAEAFCPSYTLSSAQNDQQCGVEAVNGTDPTIAQWRDLIEKVSAGPTVWGSGGPAVGDIGQGCGKPEMLHQVPVRYPCELLEGIAMRESGWRQFCVPDRPTDQVGGASRTIISFDCGYGVSQVTTGMHIGENPSYNRTRVAGEALYNLATGASILAQKWRATQCVGDNQPALIEDWYTATWAYNSLSYRNNPNNPNYDANRGVWNPSAAAAAPYQEKVFGWIEYPPSGRWPSVALAYPDPIEIGGGTSPPALSEPACASPTDCQQTRTVHRSRCFPIASMDGGVADAGVGLDAGAQVDAGVDAGVEMDAGMQPEEDAGETPIADAGGESIPDVTFTGDAVQGPYTGGCGCGASAGASLMGALLLFGAVLRRRRPRLTQPAAARDPIRAQ